MADESRGRHGLRSVGGGRRDDHGRRSSEEWDAFAAYWEQLALYHAVSYAVFAEQAALCKEEARAERTRAGIVALPPQASAVDVAPSTAESSIHPEGAAGQLSLLAPLNDLADVGALVVAHQDWERTAVGEAIASLERSDGPLTDEERGFLLVASSRAPALAARDEVLGTLSQALRERRGLGRDERH